MGMEVQVDAAEDNANDVETSLLLIKQDMVKALKGASKNEMVEYENLLRQWRDLHLEDPGTDNFLKFRLKALSLAVSFIRERDHDMIISYILGMSLWMHNLDVGDALIEFVINLATVNGGCTVRCLDMLIRNFLPPSSGLPIFIDFFSRRALMKGMQKETLIQMKMHHVSRKDDILQRVHSAIARISELVPMTTLHLKPIVIQRMPHRVVDKEWNALYIENMLRLARDAPGEFLRSQMLMAVIDRLIEIDVEIRWEDILQEDDSSKVLIFDMEFDETLEEDETIAGGGPGSEAHQMPSTLSNIDLKKRQSLCAVADKMDILMDMTLQHLKNYIDAGQIEEIFNILMNCFQSTIIDTYKSKFTQFLIFYVCSVAPTTCGAKFASLLCDVLLSTSQAPNTRMSAAAYLASFLARAKCLPLTVITSSLKRVVDWCINYIPRQSDNKGIAVTVDSGVHGVFYSACQAVMYVLCFRMRTLLDDAHEREALRRMHVKGFVKHPLNPLKLCLPSVVQEFLKQGTKARLMDEDLSKKLNQGIEDLALNTFGGINRLDMFFPFDPYLLKLSDRFIRPNFIFWSMVPTHNDDDDDEYSDVDFESEEGELDLDNSPKGADACSEMCITPSSVPPRGAADCSDMCITPTSISTRSDKKVVETDTPHADADVCGKDKDADETGTADFELSMNQMSLTTNYELPLQILKHINQPIPLPAKLTPDYLLHLSVSLV